MRKIVFALLFILVSSFLFTPQTNACTGIRLTAQNGDVVYGRTLEWGPFDLQSRIAIIPQGYTFKGLTPDGHNGKTYTTKYGIVAVDMVKQDFVSDGMNEAGLTAGMFYHPGCSAYAPYEKSNAQNCISAQEVPNYILSQFANIDEVKEGLTHIDIVGVIEESLGFEADCHWMVTDPIGRSIIIECTNHETKIYDAPLGVITNAPNYDWHITNIRNYVNLSMFSIPTKDLSGIKFGPTGAGSGFIGLPGDYTPPSRFIRAVAWTQTARKFPDGKEGIYEVFRILDNFQLPLESGETVPENMKPKEPELMRSSTQWTTAWNLNERVFNYHTQHNRRVRQIKLKEINFSKIGKEIIHIPMDETKEEDILDMTPKL